MRETKWAKNPEAPPPPLCRFYQTPTRRRRLDTKTRHNPKAPTFTISCRKPRNQNRESEMEDEGIGAALAKAMDLRLKISNCIHNATASASPENKGRVEGGSLGSEEANGKEKVQTWSEAEDEDENSIRLLHIRDSLEALENQLSHLQDLQQQQLYERKVARAEIEHSRETLFRQLKEYKGEDLQVIQEVSAFVGDVKERDQDLILPPYGRIPKSQFPSRFPSSTKSVQNGVTNSEAAENLKESESEKRQPKSQNSGKLLGHVIGAAAKTMITVAGVMYVLSMSGFGPSLSKRNFPLKISGLLQQPNSGEKSSSVECPPGRVLVEKDRETRCVVKERVAVPFQSMVTKPDVNYGCG